MKNQLCWTCTNACGRCSWSKDLTPVVGWTAKEVPWVDPEIVGETTYQVFACPEYAPDPRMVRKSDRVANTVSVACRATCLTTGEVRTYPSVSATKSDGFRPNAVFGVLSGLCSQHKGWKFERVVE